MTVLEEIMTKICKSPLDQQVKQICDVILEEEKATFNCFNERPQGPNIFLSLEIPVQVSTKCTYSYLCLEREMNDTFVISMFGYTIQPGNDIGLLRRLKVFPIEDKFKAEDILKEYAKKLQYFRGVV